MVDPVKHREDTDGCACLECRGVRTVVLRRTAGDIVLWALGFLRRRPSIVVLILVLAAVQVAVRVGSVGPALTVGLVSVGFVGALFARGYVAALASGNLAETQYASRTAAAYALRRLPAVIGTWIATIGCVLVVAAIGGTLVGVALGIGGFSPTPAAPRSSPPLAVTAGFLAMTGLAVAVVVKFVFATEAAVVGGYGPLESLRVSWGLVSFRRRATIALLGLVLSALAPVVVWDVGLEVGPEPFLDSGIAHATVGSISVTVSILWYVLSCLLFAHLYVQRIVDAD